MLPPWDNRTISGRTYSLAHLQPFTVKVTPKAEGAPTFKLFVSFGSHTFSREWRDDDHAEHRMDDGREVRCFCPVRHGHSLHLPAIINQGVTGRAYFSQRHNFLLVHNLPGLNGPYAVFFNVEKAKSADFDAAMFVVSAYEKPGLPRKLPAITFPTLISKIAAGLPVIRPKK